jgi:hypothetical protein
MRNASSAALFFALIAASSRRERLDIADGLPLAVTNGRQSSARNCRPVDYTVSRWLA